MSLFTAEKKCLFSKLSKEKIFITRRKFIPKKNAKNKSNPKTFGKRFIDVPSKGKRKSKTSLKGNGVASFD